MTTISNRLRALHWAVILAALAAMFGCSDKTSDQHASPYHKVKEENKYKVKKIPPAIMDSLRVKKQRYQITRDAYWDDKGGVLENSYLEVWYPPGVTTVTHGMHVFEQIVLARQKVKDFFGVVPLWKLKVVCTPEMEDFKKITGRDWWQYSKIEDRQITYQPIYILYQRKLDVIAVQHEYFEWAVDRLSDNQLPRWIEEGLASYLSGEEKVLAAQLTEYPDANLEMPVEEIEKLLRTEKDRKLTRIAYYHAYRMVQTLIDKEGEFKLATLILRLGDGVNKDQAYSLVFNKPYADVLAEATDYSIDKMVKPVEDKP